jgi:hypothetical protein
MRTAVAAILVLAACIAVTADIEAGAIIYYMPFFTTDPATPTYCWTANKTTGTVTASIQIMTGSSATLPSQTALPKTISITSKQSKMITFAGTAISADNTSIDILSEVGSGVGTAYSADITFTSSGTLSCLRLAISCFQGTTSPKRNLVGYTCYDGTYFTY